MSARTDGRPMSQGGYRRPHRWAWWMERPGYMRFMIRELTSFFMAGYLVVFLVTLSKVGAGDAAFAEWGDLEAAREAHRKAVEMAEAMQFGEILEDLQRILGRIDELAGDYTSSIDSYRAAMAADPGVRLQRALGRTLRKAGRMDEAEAELREALVPVPAQPNTHFELALVLEARGDLAGAVEHLRSALAAWENADADYALAASARAKLEELGG